MPIRQQGGRFKLDDGILSFGQTRDSDYFIKGRILVLVEIN
jgi:hypothetical protein